MFKTNLFARVIPAGIFALLLFADDAAAQTKLLRFPDLHGDRVAFTYGGDIWTAPATGGTAIRLTAHPGIEVFAKFSPDGNWRIIEGHGVDLDIEVDNDPKSEITGRDPQLERGIAEVMAKLKNPLKLPPRPAAPVKTIK